MIRGADIKCVMNTLCPPAFKSCEPLMLPMTDEGTPPMREPSMNKDDALLIWCDEETVRTSFGFLFYLSWEASRPWKSNSF